MDSPQDQATHLMYAAAASSLAAIAGRIDDAARLLVPPDARDWSGATSTAFGHSLHSVYRQVVLAADLAASAGRFASDAAGTAGRG